jgi:GNAT superfamily N-acetyltransferase
MKYLKSFNESVNEGEILFTKDEILNSFLNKLNKKAPLMVNPMMRQEFIYDNKGSLEFSRFDKKDRNEITLQDIAVFDKKQGVGKSIMQDIVDVADELGTKLTLTAKPFGNDPNSLKKKDLIEFYKKFGFVTDMNNFGGEFKSEDSLIKYVLKYPEEGLNMYRIPKAKLKLGGEFKEIKI